MQPIFVLMLFCLIVQPTQDYKFVDTCTVILSPDASLYLNASIFVPKRHSIDSCQIGPADDTWKGICLIDRRPVFGTD